MGQRPLFESDRRHVGAWSAIAAVVVASVAAVAVPATVSAAIAPAGQLCFSVNGTPGDAAIINLTPVQASGSSNSQLISSNVKTNPPTASNTNFNLGTVDPNVAITPIGNDGQVCYQNSIHSSVDLVADHLGTIAADAYTPATPTGAPNRRVDTRNGNNGQRLTPAGQLCFSVNGTPGDAAIINLTPVQASGSGNGQLISSNVKTNPPTASNTNFNLGTVDPNVAITPIGNDGQVCYQNSIHSSVDLVADHLGTIAADAYTPATPTGAPNRRVDTRNGNNGQRLTPAGQLCFSVNGTPGDAAIINLTPVQASGSGNGQLISSNVKTNPPTASNTNFNLGTVDPNVAITPIGNDGQVCYQNSIHSSVDLVADHLGTIAAAAYTPATPAGAPNGRVDTRNGNNGQRPTPAGQLCFSVNGTPGDAAIINLTPVQASGSGNGQLISSNVKTNPPTASNTNFNLGTVDPNVAITPIGNDGQVCYQNSIHSSVDLVADHLGTIAADAYTPATPTGAPNRRVDTRNGNNGQRLTPAGQLCFSVNGTPGDAAIINLTPVQASGSGNGQLISSNVKTNPPTASNTNFNLGTVDPNV